jgi:diacylglycerol kinase family enzyme
MLEVDGERRGFLFGNGMFARYIEAYEAGVPGPRRAATVLARAVGSAVIGGAFARRLTDPIAARVTVDGVWHREGRWLTVAAGTIDQVGLGFRPFFGAVEQPGTLHALAIGGSPFTLARQLRYAWSGRSMRSPDIADRVGRELRIEASAPQLAMMDGDLIELGPNVVVRVGPRLDLLVPKRIPIRAG